VAGFCEHGNERLACVRGGYLGLLASRISDMFSG
jgi:hypothetical protein